jgi:hypothetical protein
MSAPSAAGVLLAELRQPSLVERPDGFGHRAGLPAVEDLDPHLLKSHEGPHAHAAGQQHPHPVLRQMADRRHAAALFVGDVGDDIDGCDLPVVYGDQ